MLPACFRHEDFQYWLDYLQCIFVKNLPGCSLLNVHNNAGLCGTHSRKIHAHWSPQIINQDGSLIPRKSNVAWRFNGVVPRDCGTGFVDGYLVEVNDTFKLTISKP